MPTLLFRRFPGLRLPVTSLGKWPTPVAPLAVGDRRLWVKDEGRAGRMGGNNVRKLELLLADAQARGHGDLLTLGTVGSSHVLATALYGRQLGMRPFALLVPQPDAPFARRNARLIDAMCEGWVAVRHPSLLPLWWARQYATISVVGGRAPYPIPRGGSNALGALGWVAGGLELAEDVRAGRLPRLDRVFVAAGTGGTAAGLWLGLRIGGCDAEVVAVRGMDRWIVSAARIRQLARGALGRLREAGATVEEPRWTGLRVARGEALDLAREAVRGGSPHEGVVFVDTVDAQPLDDLLAEALPDVPMGMRALLT